VLLEHLLPERVSHNCALLPLYYSAAPSPEDAKEIRVALYALDRAANVADIVLGIVDGIECPSPEAGACSGPKTASVQAALAVKVVLDQVRQRFDDYVRVLH
jgi:hypothetical protein